MTWFHRKQVVIPAPTTIKIGGNRTVVKGSLAHRIRNEKVSAYKRSAHSPGWTQGAVGDLWKRYRLTPEQWLEIIDVQAGRCGLCHMPFHGWRGFDKPNIDHLHDTFIVRGALCRDCNWHMGWLDRLKGSPERYRTHSRWFTSRSLTR
jgi:hypothetical protein